jgi:hypothetical protein
MGNRIDRGALESAGQMHEADRLGFQGWVGALLWIALIIVAVLAIFVGGGWAQTTDSGSSPDSKIRFQSGQVTAKQGNSLQINKQSYSLHPEVIITDDEGKPRNEKDLVPGVEVRFHLKRGIIDQVIVILPK